MTLLNKALCCVICFVIFLIWSTPPSVGGAFISEDLTPTEFLAQLESSGELKEGAYQCGDFVLAIASERARTARAVSSQGATARAEEKAKELILQDAVERAELEFNGVKEVPEGLNAKLISISQKSVNGTIDGAYVLRTRVIGKDAEGKELIEVVLVCPLEGIAVSYSKPVEVSVRLRRDFMDSKLSSTTEQLLAFELFTDARRVQMLQILAEYLAGEKKNGIWATLMHDFSESTAESLVCTEQFDSGQKLSELFAILDENPNHPAVCLEIANKMIDFGFPQVAALFAARGTHSYLDIIGGTELRKIAEGTWAESLLNPIDEMASAKHVTEVLLSEWTENYPRTRVLLMYNGKVDPSHLKTNSVLDDEFKAELIDWGNDYLQMNVIDQIQEFRTTMSDLYKAIESDPQSLLLNEEKYRQQIKDAKINCLEILVVMKLRESFIDGKDEFAEVTTNAILATEQLFSTLPVLASAVGSVDIPINDLSIVHYAAKAYEQYPSPSNRELLSKAIDYSGYSKIAGLID